VPVHTTVAPTANVGITPALALVAPGQVGPDVSDSPATDWLSETVTSVRATLPVFVTVKS
jgi:hypothetical protein